MSVKMRIVNAVLPKYKQIRAFFNIEPRIMILYTNRLTHYRNH